MLGDLIRESFAKAASYGSGSTMYLELSMVLTANPQRMPWPSQQACPALTCYVWASFHLNPSNSACLTPWEPQVPATGLMQELKASRKKQLQEGSLLLTVRGQGGKEIGTVQMCQQSPSSPGVFNRGLDRFIEDKLINSY